MTPFSIVGAAIGGSIGALIWAAISYSTGYEIGWIAWGVGALVGFGGALTGGRGTASGVSCAAIALAAIFLGKYLGMHFVYEAEGGFDCVLQDAYRELRSDARSFARVKSERDYPAFMVRRDYSEARSKSKVSPEEIADFKEYDVPVLRWVVEQKPTFEEWRGSDDGQITERVARELLGSAFTTGLFEGFGVVDFLLILLGMATAFKIPAGRDEEGACLV